MEEKENRGGNDRVEDGSVAIAAVVNSRTGDIWARNRKATVERGIRVKK